MNPPSISRQRATSSESHIADNNEASTRMPRTGLPLYEIGEAFAGRLLRITPANPDDADDISPLVKRATIPCLSVTAGSVALDGFADDVGPRLPATSGHRVEGTFCFGSQSNSQRHKQLVIQISITRRAVESKRCNHG